MTSQIPSATSTDKFIDECLPEVVVIDPDEAGGLSIIERVLVGRTLYVVTPSGFWFAWMRLPSTHIKVKEQQG